MGVSLFASSHDEAPNHSSRVRAFFFEYYQAIGIEVEDAADAYRQCMARCGTAGVAANASVQPPTRVSDLDGRGAATISEIRAYGDVVLRFISFEAESGPKDEEGEEAGGFTGAFLPNFVDVGVGDDAGGGVAGRENFGLQRADHIVGNVWDMLEHVSSPSVCLCVCLQWFSVMRCCTRGRGWGVE